MKKIILIFVVVVCLAMTTSPVLARVRYSGSHHTTSHGGHYAGGHSSSHKGGHYSNPRTGNHYGCHKC